MEPLTRLSPRPWGRACWNARVNVTVLHAVCLILLGSMGGGAAELKPILLPEPDLQGGKPLMEALQRRQSIRDFDARPLSPRLLGDALWAAFGINRPEEGRRTAPSAMNSQEVTLYIALPEGLYVYDARQHRLDPVLTADLRPKAGQSFSASAPAVFIFVADLPRLSRAAERDRRFYAAVDTGAISQNLYLFCASENLATVVHDLDRKPLEEAMQLKEGQEIILAQAVGHPGRATLDSIPWVALFNGKDLSGWQVRCQPKDAQKVFWQVEDGAIVCDSMGRKDHDYVWLMTEREYEDFELRLKFKAYRDNPGNSGLQFRSRFDPTADGGWLDGPQVDIHPPGDMSWRTGLIYDETREERRWVFPSLKNWEMPAQFKPAHHVFRYADEGDGWNDLVLICRGMQVVTIVNGVTRADWDASGVLDNAAHVARNVGRRGYFALQLHSSDELRIRFKDIYVREY